MCNHIVLGIRKCLKSPKKDFCHMHMPQKISQVENLIEILNLKTSENKLIEDLKTVNSFIKTQKKAYNDLYSQHEKNVNEHNSCVNDWKKDMDRLKQEVKGLNKTIEKKNQIIKNNDLTTKAALVKKEISILKVVEVTLNRNEETEKELLNKISKFQLKISQLELALNNSKLNELLMMEDYNSFQIIKEFEKHKHELLEKNIDLYNYDDSDFHEERINRNYIVHQKILQN